MDVAEWMLGDEHNDRQWLGMLSSMDDKEDYLLMCPKAEHNIVVRLNLKLSDSQLLDSHCFAHVD